MEFVNRFVRAFGAERIGALIGDREFVGGDWFRWLRAKGAPFVMRVRDNFKVPVASGARKTDARNCFRGFRVEESRRLGAGNVRGGSRPVRHAPPGRGGFPAAPVDGGTITNRLQFGHIRRRRFPRACGIFSGQRRLPRGSLATP